MSIIQLVSGEKGSRSLIGFFPQELLRNDEIQSCQFYSIDLTKTRSLDDEMRDSLSRIDFLQPPCATQHLFSSEFLDSGPQFPLSKVDS